MKTIAMLFLAALAGCSTTGGALTVKVPVPVECKESMPPRPAMPTEGLKPGGKLFASTIALQAEIELREGYEGKLRTALAECIAPIKPAAQ
ncbi:hypothetical protein J7E70_02355 [Variovorax paradoxus]|nr:hypothetical protein [Variovorax paradoxus]MBT2299295.1 hypothetical protein [Variovorax paradoxus]